MADKAETILLRSRERASKVLQAAVRQVGCKREKSLNETLQVVHFYGYGRHVCLHDKAYIEPCRSCRRGMAEVRTNLNKMLAKS
jgi:hypothetical protein